jgi:hypothetical protein
MNRGSGIRVLGDAPGASTMFLFFSNKLGWGGSILISLSLTVVILVLLGVL